MKTLSEYLKDYLKDNLFNNGKLRDGETFDVALERILHEGIFAYRKSLSCKSCYEPTMAIDVFNTLMNIENKENMDLFRD